MMNIKLLSAAIAVFLVGTVVWMNWPEQVQVEPMRGGRLPTLESRNEPLLPLPELPVSPAAKVKLGEALFFESRLSRTDTLSCAGCHDLKRGGVDQLKFSFGVNQAQGNINAPTVFNAALNFVQFWDGRAATLEEQASGPIHNPVEMDSNWPEVLAKLNKVESYRRNFAAVYADGITPANVVDAIAAYERTLLTPSRFDHYLRGNTDAITKLERTGYAKFKDFGCSSCHQGAGVGGNMFQRFGVLDDYFSGRKIGKADLGRFNVTGLEEDRHVFKVPSLRNVALTPPYFHDGSAKTLEEAVRIMAKYQLGRELSKQDIHAIVAFLHSLSGEWQGRQLQ